MPLSLLKQLGRHLVDIHGQMEYLSLLDIGNQLNLVDAYGNLLDQRRDLRRTVKDLRAKEKELASMNSVEKEGYAELLQYQLEEIDRARLEEVDEEQMREERDILRRAEAICGGCMEAYGNLYGDERSASVMIHKTLTSLRSISSVDPAWQLTGKSLKMSWPVSKRLPGTCRTIPKRSRTARRSWRTLNIR